jgi:hypothetical protein
VRAAELLESFAAQRGTTRDVSPSPSS